MKTGILVCDAMTERPVTLGSNTPVIECAKVMEKNHVGSILVIGNKKPVGIVTEQDIVRKGVASGLDIKSLTLENIMSKKFSQISPERDIYDALLIMKNKNIRHLPVIDGNILVGYITGKDILKIQPHLFETLAEVIELREEQRKLRALGP